MKHIMENRNNNIFDNFFETTSNPYHYLFHKNFTIISLQFSLIQVYIDTVCLLRPFDFVHLDSTCRWYFMVCKIFRVITLNVSGKRSFLTFNYQQHIITTQISTEHPFDFLSMKSATFTEKKKAFLQYIYITKALLCNVADDECY